MNKMKQAVEAQQMIQSYVKSVLQAVVDGVIKPAYVGGYAEELEELPTASKLDVYSLEERGENLYIQLNFWDGEGLSLEIPQEQLALLDE